MTHCSKNDDFMKDLQALLTELLTKPHNLKKKARKMFTFKLTWFTRVTLLKNYKEVFKEPE